MRGSGSQRDAFADTGRDRDGRPSVVESDDEACAERADLPQQAEFAVHQALLLVQAFRASVKRKT